MAKSTTISFRGGSVTPGQGIDEGDINPLVVNRKLPDGTPQQQTYDPLTANQYFDIGRVKFKKNGVEIGSYDPFDSDKNIVIPSIENELSQRITDETNRAQAAEAAAHTVVSAGAGIQVQKVVDGVDGHDEYIVSTDIPVQEATSTQLGVVKTGDDIVQTVQKNNPSHNKHRTYPVQKNADSQMVVNIPWKDGASERYKGVVTVLIQGACIDTVDPITGVASKVVSDTFQDVENFPSGDNQITNIIYREVTGKPSDSKPEFHVDNSGHLYYTFAEGNQEWLMFDMTVHFDTMQGFNYFDDGDVEFVVNSAHMQQPVMAINQRIPVQKTTDGVGERILDGGFMLTVPKSNNLGSSYKIVLRAEYWYTSSPPEFFVYNAVDENGNQMVDENGNNMVIYEDNPNYTGE